MLSSDKNVETLAQLIVELRKYIGLQKEYLKFDVIDKVVRLVSAFILAIIFLLLALGIGMFLALSFAFWLADVVGLVVAFAIVAGVFLLLFLVVFTFRRPWIERPLVRFMANILLNK